MVLQAINNHNEVDRTSLLKESTQFTCYEDQVSGHRKLAACLPPDQRQCEGGWLTTHRTHPLVYIMHYPSPPPFPDRYLVTRCYFVSVLILFTSNGNKPLTSPLLKPQQSSACAHVLCSGYPSKAAAYMNRRARPAGQPATLPWSLSLLRTGVDPGAPGQVWGRVDSSPPTFTVAGL